MALSGPSGGAPSSACILIRRLLACPSRSAHAGYPWAGAIVGRMPEHGGKARILSALEDLPSDATLEDAIERLVFLAKVEEGLAELDRGEGVAHEEVRRRLGL